MSETSGGAPQPAEVQEKVKAPERELISSERVGLTTRLLLGRDALKTNNVSLPDFDHTKINQESFNSSAVKVVELSQKERKDFWETAGVKEFDQQRKEWGLQVKQSFDKKVSTGTDNEKAAWKNIFKRIGIEGEITEEKIGAFYAKYFTGQNKDIGLISFSIDIADSYLTKDSINMQLIQSDMEKLSWLANMFGENTAKIFPSVIDATILLKKQDLTETQAIQTEARTLRLELLKKANEKINDVSRLNRLTNEEKKLLNLLGSQEVIKAVPATPAEKEKQASSLKDETEPKESKPAIVIPKEQLDALKKKKIKLKEGEGEITYADLVDKVIDLKTGKVKDDLPNLDEAYTTLKQEIAGLDAPVHETLNSVPHVLISPLAWSMMDAIAQQSNDINKELGFDLLLADPKDVSNKNVALIAAPAHDFTKAKEKQTDMGNLTLREEIIKQLKEKSGLKTKYAINIHTHQAPLGEKYIATPSEIDKAQAIIALEKQSIYRWGVVTKTPDGKLHMAVFTSKKDKEGKITHEKTDVVSPDMTGIYMAPAGGFGTAPKKGDK